MPLPQMQHGFPEERKPGFMYAIQTFRVVTDHSGCVGAVRARDTVGEGRRVRTRHVNRRSDRIVRE